MDLRNKEYISNRLKIKTYQIKGKEKKFSMKKEIINNFRKYLGILVDQHKLVTGPAMMGKPLENFLETQN